PFLPTPRFAVREPLLEGMDREMQERQEGDLGAEEVLVDVCPQIDVLEQEVDRAHGADVEVDRPAKLPADLVEEAVHLFERLLEAREALRPLGLAGRVLLDAERLEERIVA